MSDQLYHRLFSHPRLVEDLIRGFLPEAMTAGIDFARMRRINAKAHGQALDGDIHRREGDVIWCLPTAGGPDLLLYLMVEFQSKIDWWMPVRAQIYQGLAWHQAIAERELKRGDLLPALLLVVLYNGSSRWSAPAATSDLNWVQADSPLWPYQPQCRYHLLDIGATLAEPSGDNLASYLFCAEQARHIRSVGAVGEALLRWFQRHPDHAILKPLFVELLRPAYVKIGVPIGAANTLEEVTTMLAERVEEWESELRAEGRAEGEGAALILVAESRFGALSADIKSRIAAADKTTLEAWLRRVAEADSVTTLFDLPQ